MTVSMLGITLGNETSMFCDGMRKHCFAFYTQMEYMNYTPVFLCTQTVYDWLSRNHPTISKLTYNALPDKIHTIKCIIEWEVFLPDSLSQVCTRNHIPIVRMNCGNMYHSRHIAFLKNKSNFIHTSNYVNEYWSLPHYSNANQMKQHIYQRPCKTIPYIFGFTQQICSFNHSSQKGPYSILILEPNIHSTKHCFVPLIATIRCLQKHPTILQDIQIYCSKHIQHSIQSLLQSFETTVDLNKIRVLGRIPFPSIIQSQTNRCIILSHQTNNNLNNLYFDAIEYGIPLIHNSEAIKDIGWFYSDHDVKTICDHILIIQSCQTLQSKLQSDYVNLKKKYSPKAKTVIDQMKLIVSKIL